MAKRNSTRRKARKPKFINVEGHMLTEAQHADYQHCITSRANTNQGITAPQLYDLALADFLATHRPSSKIKGQISEIYTRITRAALAIVSMDDYPFFTPVPSSVRSAGCELLREMALELYNESAKLTGIAMNVEAKAWKAAKEDQHTKLMRKLKIRGIIDSGLSVREIRLREVVPGMILLDEFCTNLGTLLVSRGYEVSDSFVDRMRNFGPGLLNERVRVRVSRSVQTKSE